MVKTLEASGARLRLDVEGNGWCRVTLQEGGRSTALGADRADIVARRLTAALLGNLSNSVVGRLQGMPVRWVLSLAEQHGSIYVNTEGRFTLFFQDADGKLIYTLDLSEEEKVRWHDELAHDPWALRQ